MTAEVAILNRQAIALAADSAVTTSGQRGQKIFNTVNKLFALSKHNPVGIMVYSSADVMGMPVETVVKVFRERQGARGYATLKEYHDAFERFLREDVNLFPERVRVQHCKNCIWDAMLGPTGIRNEIVVGLESQSDIWAAPTMEDVRTKAIQVIQNHAQRHAASRLIEGADTGTIDKIRADVQDIVEFCKDRFKEVFGLVDSDVEVFDDLCVDMLVKDGRLGTETGVVIAGYGTDEYFGKLLSFEFETSIHGINKIIPKESADAEEASVIVPFAQRDMIQTFVSGRALKLDRYLLRFIDEYFQDKVEEFLTDAKVQDEGAIRALLTAMSSELQTQFQQKLQQFTDTEHIAPILDTVTSMPKEELATMAEALINLTSIKRRMSADAETVGGPTDVAVISKGDGFVWIKRKHYFNTELNPNFSAKYMREAMNHEKNS